jgi:hypothetical protein
MKYPRLYDSFYVISANHKSDFKDLVQDEQEKVINRVACDAEYREKIRSLNLFLDNWLDPLSAEIVFKNQETIKQNFSLQEYGKQILGIYSEISR